MLRNIHQFRGRHQAGSDVTTQAWRTVARLADSVVADARLDADQVVAALSGAGDLPERSELRRHLELPEFRWRVEQLLIVLTWLSPRLTARPATPLAGLIDDVHAVLGEDGRDIAALPIRRRGGPALAALEHWKRLPAADRAGPRCAMTPSSSPRVREGHRSSAR